MDILKREMQRKRKALQEAQKRANEKDDGAFVRVTDLRRIEEEQRQAEWEAKSSSSSLLKQTQQHNPSETSVDDTQQLEHFDNYSVGRQKKKQAKVQDGDISQSKEGGDDGTEHQLKILPAAELTRKLRHLGLPVRLFGESLNDQHRQERLNQAMEGRTLSLLGQSERREYQLEKGHRIHNPFLEKDEQQQYQRYESSSRREQEQSRMDETKRQLSNKQGTKVDHTNGTKKAPHNDNKNSFLSWEEKDPHDQILDYFQDLLLQWERQLAVRPDHVKQTLAGKTETKTVRQCRDYIRPLFQACQARQLDQNTLLQPLARITQLGRAGEFVQAHQAYMDVAIGRAAWPIGVTMVGIHARTGRAKIESANVAHVMNSELQRKYLTSIKRLLTFAQSQRDDVDPSKKVLS